MINGNSSIKSLSNKQKGKILESIVSEAIEKLGYYHYDNIQNGKRDLDHIIVDDNSKIVYLLEDKNVNTAFRLYNGWFKSHVVDRFLHLPKEVRNYRERGYRIIRVLIISKFNIAHPSVIEMIEEYGIIVIEVGKQILEKTKKWVSLMKARINYLLKLHNNDKLNNCSFDLKYKIFDSDMTGRNLKLLNFSNYLKGENCGIKFKRLYKQLRKWISQLIASKILSFGDSVTITSRLVPFILGSNVFFLVMREYSYYLWSKLERMK